MSMHYFICQPCDSTRPPFVVMTDSVGLQRLVLGSKRSDNALADAQRRVFGEAVQSFAALTAAEYFSALRAAREPGDMGPDGGTHDRLPVDPPKPRKPRGGLQARMAAAGVLS